MLDSMAVGRTLPVNVFVQTDRLVLRRFTDADVENLVRLDSEPAVMRFLTGEPTPRDEIEHGVLPRILRDYQLGPAGRFAVIERSTAAFVGWLALQPPQDGSVTEVELGYLAHAVGLGPRIRHRRRAGVDPEGLHRTRR
ncbi:GNAT family N-acetyltransferase [Nocardia sp. NPDC055321]